jgi:hypothetical protein
LLQKIIRYTTSSKKSTGKLVHGGLDLADSSKLTANPARRSPSALEKTTKNQLPLVGRGETRCYDPRRRRRRGAPEARGRRTDDDSRDRVGGGSDEGVAGSTAARGRASEARERDDDPQV